MEITSPKIVPFLWFKGQSKEAVAFYCTVFKNSKIRNSTELMTEFELDGVPFIAIDGKENAVFNDAISFFVACDDQEEIDYYWGKLKKNGRSSDLCGQLKDRFGLSWHIIPKQLGKLISDPDKEKSNRVLEVLIHSKKIKINDLQNAYDGKEAVDGK
jgi:predicted 3-demethylubiquinone-9 3-methyltransferase (glyoxalase superfamily)